MALSAERVRPYQLVALGVAVAGIVLIGLRTGGDTSLLGLALVLVAAFSWACGNMVSRRARDVNMLAYVVWASAFAIPPLLILSFAVEGPSDIRNGLGEAGLGTWFAVVYQSAGNTMFGYGVWSWLLSRHPAAAITPTALLVPVFGFASAAIFLDEPLPAWKLAAATLVLFGLSLNFIVPRVLARQSPTEPASMPQPSAPVP
jgi:O-acetylserine/cysteine efflux transporter